jgi:hypothetical protein
MTVQFVGLAPRRNDQKDLGRTWRQIEIGVNPVDISLEFLPDTDQVMWLAYTRAARPPWR